MHGHYINQWQTRVVFENQNVMKLNLIQAIKLLLLWRKKSTSLCTAPLSKLCIKTCCNLARCVEAWCWTQFIIWMPQCNAPHLQRSRCPVTSQNCETSRALDQPDSSKMKKAALVLTRTTIKHQPINIKAVLCHISLSCPPM